MDKLQELRKIYGRVKAFTDSIPSGFVSRFYLSEYDIIVHRISKIIEDDLTDFSSNSIQASYTNDGEFYSGGHIRSRSSQLVAILEYGYNVSDTILEIGSLYKAIKDNELRERCGDLLTAPSHFDRVINQATLVLEDRIRKRTGLDKSLFGQGLINATIKPDPSNSKIVFSNVASEQEGYANIVRGIMQALRNETHHNIVDNFSREDALSVCGFIDRILRLIDAALVK
jgi:uncharacterized protein (TIGR02391 family)